MVSFGAPFFTQFQRELRSNEPVGVGSKDRRVENVLATTRLLVLPRGGVCIRAR
jgi:hypothetical protein